MRSNDESEMIDSLRGQLQNAVSQLEGARRAGYLHGRRGDSADAAIQSGNRILYESLRARPRECVWQDDPREPYWSTECGDAYTFLEGGPKDNGMKYCCYCGGAILTPNSHSVAAMPHNTDG